MKKTLLFLTAFILGLNAFSQIPNYVPSNGLVGWWPFNGNANDESGNGNNGTVNGAILTTDRFGTANQAYGFDGVDDKIIAPIVNPLLSNWSVSFWYNSQNASTNFAGQNVIGIGSNNFGFGGAGFQISGQIAPGQCPSFGYLNQAYFIDASQECGGNFIGGGGYSNSIWYHIVINKNQLNYTLVINGVGIISNNLFDIDINQIIFGNRDISFQYFKGVVDDIGIWNRALTPCEIQDLYHAQLNSASLSISAGADQSICAGDNVTLSGSGGSNYQWNNNVVDGQAFTPTQSNAYVVSAEDSLGCTGTDTVVVTVLENSASTLTETALDSYTLNGQTYTQSGTYTQTLTAANGCDSTITLNLTLNFTGIDELGTGMKKLVKITDLNGKIIPRRKNTLMLFIYEDGTVERVVEMEE
jgi:hypothetical protein